MGRYLPSKGDVLGKEKGESARPAQGSWDVHTDNASDNGNHREEIRDSKTDAKIYSAEGDGCIEMTGHSPWFGELIASWEGQVSRQVPHGTVCLVLNIAQPRAGGPEADAFGTAPEKKERLCVGDSGAG